MKKIVLGFISILLLVVITGCSDNASGEKNDKPKKITLDYAYYSPTSLILREFGWVEEEFKKDGIEVEFVLSQGSNKALEFLNSSSVDFGSTAGAAALLAKAKGSPIESVYVFSKPEWTALVTNKDSDIKSVKDLKGKKVAATLGTDPYIFLLRALNDAGLSADDVEIINLQHADGAAALSTNQVDAWAGLDPHMAKVELTTGAELFYRNPDFNTYGVLNVRSDFAEKYPNQVEKVIELYEKARKWAIENPQEAAEILAKEASIDIDVALKQLERTDYSNSLPGNEQVEALQAAGEVLQKGTIIDKDTDLEKVVAELINPDYAKKIIKD
ncbi:aliphatic sulfonate ABC transporter substrate-binding protein [Paenisporosarcina antarctica]|uniref:Putative aliphatic sulfonates-binding protein n=1 Tax=Paenisporosarcina antarctica TaxID=417367 RepID=A0A4P6ZVR7_9BACL|nr:aliphatic sulfonate ABC transporter substrate-binding protein [Paenisporosarcina antarctica]QBP40264.1 aliphatic sulfonate ABC transporter substrate-binding protein [Paenisporosarcina antarctica]